MPIQYPTNRKEVADRVKTDIQAELPESDPFLRNSYLQALAVGDSGAIYDVYKTIEILQSFLFPDTAKDDFAVRWGTLKNIIRNPATKSAGYINVTGAPGSIIPINTTLQSNSGIQYITKNIVPFTILPLTIYISILTRSGGIVTATTVSDHGLSSSNSVIISGATPSDYNGTFVITVTGINSFTYTIPSTPITPATGTIIANINAISIPVESIGYGLETNIDSGGELIFSSSIPGVDSSAYVSYLGLTGGLDIESDVSYRNRYEYAYQHPFAFWNESSIVSKAMEINGVTRVFVEETTPDTGQVTIYFMRDNDLNPIPTPIQVSDVKNRILTIRPADRYQSDIFVNAPTPVIVNFSFSFLEPSSNEMQGAIIESLRAMFSSVPVVSQTLSKYAYESAIYQTVDPSTGQFVTSFTLASPTTDITISDGQIAVLGTITF